MKAYVLLILLLVACAKAPVEKLPIEAEEIVKDEAPRETVDERMPEMPDVRDETVIDEPVREPDQPIDEPRNDEPQDQPKETSYEYDPNSDVLV